RPAGLAKMVEASSATAAAPANASPSPLGLWSTSWKPAARARSAAESAAHSASAETANLKKPDFILPPSLTAIGCRADYPAPSLSAFPSALMRPTLVAPRPHRRHPLRPDATRAGYNDFNDKAKLRARRLGPCRQGAPRAAHEAQLGLRFSKKAAMPSLLSSPSQASARRRMAYSMLSDGP